MKVFDNLFTLHYPLKGMNKFYVFVASCSDFLHDCEDLFLQIKTYFVKWLS